MPNATPCVEDETLFALARGELNQAALTAVEAHVQGCADCRAVLAEAARSLEHTSSADDSGQRGPTSIERYEVVALLGAGASGIVYRGFDPRLKRSVALKLLRPEQHGNVPDQSQRLLREARAMAKLSDPHVVAVYDAGIHEGLVYLVMEYVDGHTLSQWLRQERRSTAEILRVFSEAARGLSAAHREGLVHRDFKPENVLVTRAGHAKVTDFGLASAGEARFTEQGAGEGLSTELYAPTRGLVGTPAYMAPELFDGGRATRQSDQFAFAVALFVALFERHPFKAGQGIGLEELITRMRTGTIERPTLVDAKRERLFGALARGLRASPDARYGDLHQLMAGCERAATGRRPAWLLAAALVLAGAGLVAWRLAAVDTAVPSSRAAPSSAAFDSAAPAAPAASSSKLEVLGRSAASAALAPPAPAPSAVSAPPARRRAPKSGDVRYKDWLKDPF